MGVFNFNDNSDEFEKALDEQLEAGLEAVGLDAKGFAKQSRYENEKKRNGGIPRKVNK
jgi:hypothetical protein